MNVSLQSVWLYWTSAINETFSKPHLPFTHSLPWVTHTHTLSLHCTPASHFLVSSCSHEVTPPFTLISLRSMCPFVCASFPRSARTPGTCTAQIKHRQLSLGLIPRRLDSDGTSAPLASAHCFIVEEWRSKVDPKAAKAVVSNSPSD